MARVFITGRVKKIFASKNSQGTVHDEYGRIRRGSGWTCALVDDPRWGCITIKGDMTIECLCFEYQFFGKWDQESDSPQNVDTFAARKRRRATPGAFWNRKQFVVEGTSKVKQVACTIDVIQEMVNRAHEFMTRQERVAAIESLMRSNAPNLLLLAMQQPWWGYVSVCTSYGLSGNVDKLVEVFGTEGLDALSGRPAAQVQAVWEQYEKEPELFFAECGDGCLAVNMPMLRYSALCRNAALRDRVSCDVVCALRYFQYVVIARAVECGQVYVEHERFLREVPSEGAASFLIDRTNALVVDQGRVFYGKAYRMARDIGAGIRKLCDRSAVARALPDPWDPERTHRHFGLEDYLGMPGEQQVHLDLDEVQTEAFMRSFSHELLFVTGGPGSGKTHTISAICRAHCMMHEFVVDRRQNEEERRKPLKNPKLVSDRGRKVYAYIALAPTGRARNVVKAMCGASVPVYTIDMAYVMFNGDCSDKVPECFGLIVDECSMLDYTLEMKVTSLAAKFRAVQIIKAGDTEQFLPILFGDPFRDQLEHYGPGRVCTLLGNHRVDQHARKLVDIGNAIRDRKPEGIEYVVGLPRGPLTKNSPASVLVPRTSSDFLEESRAIATNYKDYMSSVQFLTHSRDLAASINRMIIREFAFPKFSERHRGANFGQDDLFVGRKVMFTQNDKFGHVSNGDIGTIVSIEDRYLVGTRQVIQTQKVPSTAVPAPKQKLAQYPKGRWCRFLVLSPGNMQVALDRVNRQDIADGYAITARKSQGSQFGVVVLMVEAEQPHFTCKELYTMVTRTEKQIIFVGKEGDIGEIVLHREDQRRMSDSKMFL